MLLDSGVYTVFGAISQKKPGGMPVTTYETLGSGWYGLLQFETTPAWPTEGREEKEVSKRIRVLQDERINTKSLVVLQEADTLESLEDDVQRYEVARAYHGVDEESGEPITDLTLRAVSV